MDKPRYPYPDYANRHHRVKKRRGPATDHLCEHCGGPAAHWATIHGRDGTKPDDFIPLCVPCHHKYDGCDKGAPPGERHGSAKLTNEQVLDIYSRRAEGSTALAREYGMSVQGINNIVNGWAWRHITGAKRPDQPTGRLRGERIPRSKLTNEQVLAIYARRGESQTALGREFGISQATVWKIINDQAWTHVTGSVGEDGDA